MMAAVKSGLVAGRFEQALRHTTARRMLGGPKIPTDKLDELEAEAKSRLAAQAEPQSSTSTSVALPSLSSSDPLTPSSAVRAERGPAAVAGYSGVA